MTTFDLTEALQPTSLGKSAMHTVMSVYVQTMLEPLYRKGLVEAKTPSLGWALADYRHHRRYNEIWDDPTQLVFLAGGWGDHVVGYAANAACKLSYAACYGRDSLFLHNNSDEARAVNSVESQSAATDPAQLQWGHFGYGGAMFVRCDGTTYLAAISTWKQEEDCLGAMAVAGAAALYVSRTQANP